MTLGFVQALEKTKSSDNNEVENAQHFLQNAAQNNYAKFVKKLSSILGQMGFSQASRKAAGEQLQKYLFSNFEDIKIQRQLKWLALPKGVRHYIKSNFVAALNSNEIISDLAAHCVAYVGIAELPSGEWKGLMPMLFHNACNIQLFKQKRISSLRAIGYICQDSDPIQVSGQTDPVIGVIIPCMWDSEAGIRLAASRALFDALEFTVDNFETDFEKDLILTKLCETALSTHVEISTVAYQCLIKIIILYYDLVDEHMPSVIYPTVMEAFDSENDTIVLLGIEFWLTVCKVEIRLQSHAAEAAANGQRPEIVSKFYAKRFMRLIVPSLIEKLPDYNNSNETSDWTPSKGAYVCLNFLTRCCGDDIVPLVAQYARINATHPDWCHRESAVKAFGSILEGPTNWTLKPLIEEFIPILIAAMEDSSLSVKVTTSYIFIFICSIYFELNVSIKYLKPTVESLLIGLKAEPNVAANACTAFANLSITAYEAVYYTDAPQLQNFFGPREHDTIMRSLLETACREDGAQYKLQPLAYESMMFMINNSLRSCASIIQNTTTVILDRLQEWYQREDRSDDLQSLLCDTLQCVLKSAPQTSNTMMTSILTIFDKYVKQSEGIHEQMMVTVDTLIVTLGDDFVQYMDAFKPYLCMTLKNTSDCQNYKAALSVMSNIAKTLKAKAGPNSSDIVDILLDNVSSYMSQQLKTETYATIGAVVVYMQINNLRLVDKPLRQLLLTAVSDDPEIARQLAIELDAMQKRLWRPL